MGWLFYTVLVVCCFSVRADEAPTQAELNDLNQKAPTQAELNNLNQKAPTQAELNDLNQKAPTQAELNDLTQKLEKVESGLDPYPPSNSTNDRLERIEILVNLLLEDMYDVRVDQELLKREIMNRLEEIEAKLGGYQPTNQTGWMEFMLGAHFKDFRPIEIKTDPQVPEVHTDCRAAYEAGWVKTGMFRISPDGTHEMDVVCEQEEHGGGWTVLQRRLDGTVNFHRSWDEYSNGFGNLDGEFWIGNKNINALTENRKQTLRVELQYEGEGFYHVDYSSFWVDNEGSDFKLHLSGFSGNDDIAGDSLSYNNDKLFSTKNIDNDNDCRSCANVHRSGWWYDNCTEANLNGVYGGQSNNGIFWQSWRGFSNSLVSVRMMVRGEGNEGDKVYRDCQDAYTKGETTSGIYTISPDGISEVEVNCEQDLDNGGWTVFQRRIDGTVNFTRNWQAYKTGFGSINTEYWLGNDIIHLMTVNQDQKMKVEIEHGGLTAYADYSQFRIKDEGGKYELFINGFSNGQNNPGDSLDYSNGMYFSTYDRDHDTSSGNCAAGRDSAWWYGECSYSDLNAPYSSSYYRWNHWSGHRSPLTATRMMLKTK